MAEVKARTAPGVARVGGATISGARRLNITLKLVVVFIASLIALYPVVYVISASMNPTNTISDLIPANPTLANYTKLATDQNYPILLWLFNSIKVSALATVIGVFLTTIGAYAFSRFRFKGRRNGMLFILLIQLFPNTLALVSIYLLLLQIGDLIPWLGLNSHLGLILVYSGGSLGGGTWLMKGFFDTIPKDIDESGVVDGASGSQIFFLLLLPLLRPILAVQAVLTFIGTYGDFILARVLLTSKDNYTMSVGLSSLLGDGGANRASQWGLFAAGAVIGAVPVVIVFLFMQKQLVGGLTSGAVKG